MAGTATTLEALVGEHVLTGVDFQTIPGTGPYNEDASSMTFVLDGVAYMVVEDPADGYRSIMSEIVVLPDGTAVANTFEPCHVVARMTGADSGILECVDVETGKVVLECGTDNMDDYYPSYVASFTPENMAANQPNQRSVLDRFRPQPAPEPLPKVRRGIALGKKFGE